MDMCNSALGVCTGRSTAPLHGRNQQYHKELENSCTSKKALTHSVTVRLAKLIEARGYYVGANLRNAHAQNAYFVVHN